MDVVHVFYARLFGGIRLGCDNFSRFVPVIVARAERGLDDLFESMVAVPRIRDGSRQTLDILINEEALLRARARGTSARVLEIIQLISQRDYLSLSFLVFD